MIDVSLSSLAAGSGLNLGDDVSLKNLLLVEGVGQFSYDADGKIYKPEGAVLRGYKVELNKSKPLIIDGEQRVVQQHRFVAEMIKAHRAAENEAQRLTSLAAKDEAQRLAAEETARKLAEVAAARAIVDDSIKPELISGILAGLRVASSSLETSVRMNFWEAVQEAVSRGEKLKASIVNANDDAIKTSVRHLLSIQRQANEVAAVARTSSELKKVIEEYQVNLRNVRVFNSTDFCTYSTGDWNLVAVESIQNIVEKNNVEFVASLQRRVKQLEKTESSAQRNIKRVDLAMKAARTFGIFGSLAGLVGWLSFDADTRMVNKSSLSVLEAETSVRAKLNDAALRLTAKGQQDIKATWMQFDFEIAKFLKLNEIRHPMYSRFQLGSELRSDLALSLLIESFWESRKLSQADVVLDVPNQVVLQAYEVYSRSGLNSDKKLRLYYDHVTGRVYLAHGDKPNAQLVSVSSLKSGMPNMRGPLNVSFAKLPADFYDRTVDITDPALLAKFYRLIEGESRLLSRNYNKDDVLALAKVAEESGVQSPRIHSLGAYVYYASGDYPKAEAEFVKIVKQYPKFAFTAYANLCRVKLFLGVLNSEYIKGFLDSAPKNSSTVFSISSPLYYILHAIGNMSHLDLKNHDSEGTSEVLRDYILSNNPVFATPNDKALFFRTLAMIDLGISGVKILSDPTFKSQFNDLRRGDFNESSDLKYSRALALYAAGDSNEAKNLFKQVEPYKLPPTIASSLNSPVLSIRLQDLSLSLPSPLIDLLPQMR